MKRIIDLVESIIDYQKTTYNIDNISIKAILINKLFKNSKRDLVLVTPNILQAEKILRAINTITDSSNILYFVEERNLSTLVVESNEYLLERIYTLNSINDKKKIIITNTLGVTKFLPSPKHYLDNKVITTNQKISIQELKELLLKSGYQIVKECSVPSTMVVRGETIDVFLLNYSTPVRIEFFSDVIESIRFFDSESKRTIEVINSINIPKCYDIHFSDKEVDILITKLESLKKRDNQIYNAEIDSYISDLKENSLKKTMYRLYSLLDDRYTLLDYLDNPLVIVDSPSEILASSELTRSEIQSEINSAINNGSFYLKDSYLEIDEVLYRLHITLVNDSNYNNSIDYYQVKNINLTDHRNVDRLVEYANDKIYFVLETKFEEETLKRILSNTSVFFKDYTIINGVLLRGFKIKQTAVFTSFELFEEESQYSSFFTRYKSSIASNDDEIRINDYVVHEDYGIGIYKGITTITIDNVTSDYLVIQYYQDRQVNVPLSKTNKVRKYLGFNILKPKITRSEKHFKREKERLRFHLSSYTKELRTKYLNRATLTRTPNMIDEVEYENFSNEFIYPLTIDQEKATKEILSDLKDFVPMDRLLCGDVGFGKTEVALRAAFNVLKNNKQVVFLVPTTLLLNQHYENISKRFLNYPYKIVAVSRNLSFKEQSEIFKQINNHEVHFIIGTHKLLSNKIKYDNLGLLIIDEEHRFGVKQKEKIREIKMGVDILSLSATPIPRSLELSLVNIRKLSQLLVAPKHRLKIHTEILISNDDIIKQIIEREVSRVGQVYFIHNNISELTQIKNKLDRLLNSEIKVEIIHGALDKEEVEMIYHDFKNQKIDVLLATTIVESGIDIKNANTMIINNADHYGLAELYQLRGRVGRGHRQGYCYLFIKGSHSITSSADERLKTLKEFTELGSGYYIALRDLAIRGAGDLLGVEQSGFITSVGYDLFSSIFKECLENTRKREEVVININQSTYIDDKYAGSDNNKIEIYKMILLSNSIEELEQVHNKIIDIYGKIYDVPIINIIDKKELELLLNSNMISSVHETGNTLFITFLESVGKDLINNRDLMNSIPDSIHYSFQNLTLIFKVKKSEENWLLECSNILKKIYLNYHDIIY